MRTDTSRLSPEDLISLLVAEMLRPGAARWQSARLTATAPYRPITPGWPGAAARPSAWPR